MYKEIVLDPKRQIAIPDELTQIDIKKDIIICSRSYDTIKLLDFDIDEFIIRNRDAMSPVLRAWFKFRPYLKIIAPIGMIPNFKCVIPGLEIVDILMDKKIGIEEPNIEPSYVIYSNIEFELKIVMDDKFKANKRFIAFQIPMGTNIISLRLMQSYFGQCIVNSDAFLIQDSYLYERLPDF